MLSNIPGELILFFLIGGVCVLGASILGAFIYGIVSLIKGKRAYSKCVGILTAVAALIVVASWLFNFGWLRFVMTFIGVPVIHGVIFIVSNMLFAKHTEKSPWLVVINVLYMITYILPYVILPDGGDIGEMYFFFGLIRSDALASPAFLAAFLFALAHVFVFIVHIVMTVIIAGNEKKRIKAQTEQTGNISAE